MELSFENFEHVDSVAPETDATGTEPQTQGTAQQSTGTPKTNEEFDPAAIIDGKSEKKEESKEQKADESKDANKEPEKEENVKLSKSNRRLRNLRNHLNESNSQVEALKKEIQELKQKSGMFDVNGFPMRPDPKNYANEQSYREAWGKWQEEVQQIKVDREVNERVAQEKKMSDFYNAYQSDSKKWSKFNETMDKANMKVAPVVEEVLTDISIIDNPGDVAYALANNPDVIEELNFMTQNQVVSELTKISQQVKNYISGLKKPPKPKKELSTVGGGGSTKEDPLASDSAFDKLMKRSE